MSLLSDMLFFFFWYGHSFSSKEQVSFSFMAAVTICSDLGAQEYKVCHGFHFFPFYLPWSDGTKQMASIQSLLFNSLWRHGIQHTRLHCPSPTPGDCPNWCPLSQWYHPTISSSVIPFSSCLQSFPASGSFPRSQFFSSGGQNIGISTSASVPPMNIWDWFPLGLTGLISLQSKRLSRVFSNTTIQKHRFFCVLLSL